MISLSQNILDVLKALEEVRTAQQNLSDKIQDLYKTRDYEIISFIEKNKLLKDSVWKIHSLKPKISYDLSKNEPIYHFLNEIDNYSLNISFNGASYLYFAPGEKMYFSCSSFEELIGIIQKFEIKVDGTSLLENSKNLTKQISNVNEIIHLMGIK